MAFVNPASAVIVGAVDSHHLLGLYRGRFLGSDPDQSHLLPSLCSLRPDLKLTRRMRLSVLVRE